MTENMTDQLQENTAPESKKETVRIFVHGFVQGVNYRRWLQGEALERNISGWVRNRADGSVEAILHGDHRKVDDLVRACRHGPMMARVDKLHSEPAEYDGIVDFRVEASL